MCLLDTLQPFLVRIVIHSIAMINITILFLNIMITTTITLRWMWPARTVTHPSRV
jgi:hypothetical protein